MIGMFREKRSRQNLLSTSVSILSRILISLPSIIWFQQHLTFSVVADGGTK
jgi:hypothetical protein